jgi:ABC-2 type transport system ATP-binding protein
VIAVKNASFGLDKGECLALLGVNGAGKTTCFKVLTNEVAKTSGSVEVMGFDIQTQFADAAQLIGYCP